MRDFENAKRVFEELQSMVNGLDMIARRAMIENIPNFPSNFYDDYERVKQFFDGASVVDGNPEIENKIGEVLELFDMAELVNDHFLAAAKATHVARPTPAPARALLESKYLLCIYMPKRKRTTITITITITFTRNIKFVLC